VKRKKKKEKRGKRGVVRRSLVPRAVVLPVVKEKHEIGVKEDLAAGGKQGAAGRLSNEEEKVVEEGRSEVSKEVVRGEKEDPP
jgi:hypothetical protein